MGADFLSRHLDTLIPTLVAVAFLGVALWLGLRLLAMRRRRGAEESRDERARQDQSRILESIATGRSSAPVIDEILQMVNRRYDRMRCALLLRNQPGGAFSVVATDALHASVRAALGGIDPRRLGGALAACLEARPWSGALVTTPDDPLQRMLDEAWRERDVSCVFLQPVFSSSEEILGVLLVVGTGPTTPTAARRRLVETAGNLIGIAIDRYRTDEAQARIISQQQTLLDLARGGAGDLEEFLKQLTKTDAETLGVTRVGVWLFSEAHDEVHCRMLYNAAKDSYEAGPTLYAQKYPAYFRALNESRTIDARDAQNDPRTKEFSQDYLAPQGITSLLDVPIRVEGRLYGIVCHEHIGPAREWTLHEQDFAASIANMVGLAMESAERRRAEQAMRESEQRFRQLAENIDETFWLFDLETQRHVYVSPAYETMWGRSLEEIARDPEAWIRSVHPDDRPREIERFEEQQRGIASHSEYRIVRPDGEVRWVQDRGFAIYGDDGEVFRLAGLVEDITERKHAEAELAYRLDFETLISRISTRFIDIAPEEIDDAIEDALRQVGQFTRTGRGYIFLFSEDRSTATNTHEWCAEGVTSHQSELIDVPREQAPHLLEDVAEGRSIAINSIDELPATATYERKILTEQGISSLVAVPMIYRGSAVGFLGFDALRPRRRWAEDEMALLRIVGEILTSALQRQQIETALRESESVLRSFFDASPMGIGVIDIIGEDDIYFVDVNRQVADYLNLPMDRVIGRTAREIGITEAGNKFWYDRYMAAAKKEGTLTFEFKRELTEEWYEAVVCPIRSGEGARDRRFAFIFWDVTDRRASEERLRLLNRELNHRVKNNLAVVAALAERTAVNAPDLETFRRSFAGRIQAMSRAHSLIAEHEWRAAPLHELLERILADFADEKGEAVTTSGPEVNLSAKQASNMSLIVRELIINAAKYGALSAPKGRVAIRWVVEPGEDGAQLRFQWEERDGPPTRAPDHVGFGGDLIQRLVKFDLGGTMESRFEEAGFECEIVFPLRVATAALGGRTYTDPRKEDYSGAPLEE